MLPRRPAQTDDSLDRTSELTAAETARSVAESGSKAEPKKDEEHISLFWRVFGGTIISIVALIAINLFNNLSSSIAELRTEVAREREARSELVKKEEFNSRVTAQYERIRGIDAVKVELEGVKEKVHANTTASDAVKKDTAVAVDGIKKEVVATTDAMKKDAAALEVLKERVVTLEVIKKDVAGLESLKEKVTAALADLKQLRDDMRKVSGEIEGNKTYDLERKAFRDAQAKQIDDTLKELQKGLQDCREKLARLEGAKPAPPEPKPVPKSDDGK